MRPLTRPRRLRAGDRVAVVGPSAPLDEPAKLERGCALLRGWGLEVLPAPNLLRTHHTLGYLGGTDAERASDFAWAWRQDVAAVLCTRGGYGAHRMVDLVDWAALRGLPPKLFAGFSDLTVLHEAVATRLGLATLYAPMVAAQAFGEDAAVREHFRQTLFEPEDAQVLSSPAAHPLVPGRARGVTVGGCLSLLAADLGTPHGRRNVAGGIWLIEDIDEEDYRLDRILTQLRRAGYLDRVAGIALGSWVDCGPRNQVEAVFADRLGDLGVPVLADLGFGHGPAASTVPLGVEAELDADAGTLTLTGPALA